MGRTPITRGGQIVTKRQRKAYKSTQMTTKKGTHAFDVPVDNAVGVQIVQRVRGLGYLC